MMAPTNVSSDSDDEYQARNTNICQFCRTSVLESERLWAYHHPALSDLQHSAQEQCIFCTNILYSITARFSDLTRPKWPLYRWNIRTLTQTRETKQVVSVMFRPIDVDNPANVTKDGGTLPSMVFHLHPNKDEDRNSNILDLGASTDSLQTWTQIHKWIQDCTENHAKCRKKRPDDTFLPTRLLDITAIDRHGNASGNIRVVETKSSNVQGPYVTLSHSWGKNPKFIKMQADNQHQMMSVGFSYDNSDLSQNFRHAILVARNLGVGYIWIDSLCILQSGGEDFQREAPRMDDYYLHSYCNIAASDASTPGGGLFRNRLTSQSTQPPMTAMYVPKAANKTFGGYNWLVLPADAWKTQLLDNILYTRGWVFQERMLAPRVIHYSSKQVFFECGTISACELLPDGLPRASGVRAATDRYWRQRLHRFAPAEEQPMYGTADLSIEEFWKTSVWTYTSCELTDRSDKIVAFQGVSTLVKNTLKGEEYGYGLWTKLLEEQLAWRVFQCRQANNMPSVRPTPLFFPSWSWASVDGIIEVGNRIPPEREYTVKDHDGNPIKFESDLRSYGPSVPKVLVNKQKAEQGGTHPLQLSKADSNNRIPAVLKPSPSAIEIQGFVRDCVMEWDYHENEQKLRTLDGEDLNCQVFPDEFRPGEPVQCSFMVLAYSRVVDVSESTQNGGKTTMKRNSNLIRSRIGSVRNRNGPPRVQTASPQLVNSPGRRRSSVEPTAPTSFSGVGILLEEISPDNYYRCGAFQFHYLTETEMAALVVMPGRRHSLVNCNSESEARKIWLW